MTLPPGLVIDSIEISDKQAAAILRIGPRRDQIVLGFAIPDFIHYKRMPEHLDHCVRAKRALSEAIGLAYRGERVALPLDLSETGYNTEEPWPLWMDPLEDKSDPPVDIQVTTIERDVHEPSRTTVHMQVLGVPTVVVVDSRERLTLFRFVAGVHPWQLSDLEARAMLSALSAANQTPITV